MSVDPSFPSALPPSRRIIHVDMDAFYASVEQRDRPELRGRPVAVGGSPSSRGVVAAASYEARAFGVRSAIPMARAVRLCPHLTVIRGDFAKYRAVSQQVQAIFRSVTPLVEPLSLDEAYLDVTSNAWEEPLATTVARRLKALIKETTGLTASAGVAPNKFLAKIASAWRKPDGLTVIAPERVEAFLQKLPVDALWGVGPVTAGRLRDRGITRLVDVRGADPDVLREAIGSHTDWLLRAGARARRPAGAGQPRRQVVVERTYLRDRHRRHRSHARRSRDDGAGERGVVAPEATAGPNGHDQGPLRGLHDRHPQPHRASDRRRRPDDARAPSPCWPGPTPDAGRCGCSEPACTASAAANRRQTGSRSTDQRGPSGVPQRGVRNKALTLRFVAPVK